MTPRPLKSALSSAIALLLLTACANASERADGPEAATVESSSATEGALAGLPSPGKDGSTTRSMAIYGVVRSFDVDRGYGWITPAEGGKDLSVHRSNIIGASRLEPGQRVSFEIASDPRGAKAIQVRVVP